MASGPGLARRDERESSGQQPSIKLSSETQLVQTHYQGRMDGAPRRGAL